MKNILMPWFELNGTDSYPDDYRKFRDLELVTFNDTEYYTCGYSGDLELETGGHTYADYQAWLDSQPPITGIRNITKRSFMQRIDQRDRILIRKSTDDIVIDIREDLSMASNVDLDLQVTQDSVAYLASELLLEHTDIDLLLADGSAEEEYKGV